MKIVVSSVQGGLDSQVDPRFGRCQYFIIVDPETMEFKAVQNTAIASMHGTGIQAAQFIRNEGATAVITGNVGPNAFQALSAAGVKVITGVSGTVREAVERYKRGELNETGAPTVGGDFGVGGRRGQRWR